MSDSTIGPKANPAPDEAFMAQAAELARQGLGTTAPNPCVGAVLVRDGQVEARGWHERYGGPHAEVNCLADARDKGVNPADCTMYVTLEPCNHQGKTPPCTMAIKKAGVPRVVVGALDANPDVAGGGVAELRRAGIEVQTGVLERQCLDLVADFMLWKAATRPYVFLKLASTLDGRIATRTGHSRWISGPESRNEVHRLRTACGAVLVGGNTFRTDDPELTPRGEFARKDGSAPLAVVATSRLPGAGEDFFLVRKRAGQTVFLTTARAASGDEAKALADKGCRVWGLDAGPGGIIDIKQGLERLRAECGVWHVLCEGGGRLGLDLLEKGLADEFQLYLAPKVIGDSQAAPLFAGRTPMTMDQALGLRISGTDTFGPDLRLTLRPQE